MKAVMLLVLVCVVLAGCPPRTPSKPEPPDSSTAPCSPAKAVCIVNVDGVALIRAPAFWLLDLRGLDPNGHDELDVAAIKAAAKQCEEPKGCGVAMGKPEIEALVGELAQVKIERLPIAGALAVAYRLDPRRNVIQIWGDLIGFEKAVPQLSPVPPPACTGCGLCLPGQCEGPPPPPIRLDHFWIYPR